MSISRRTLARAGVLAIGALTLAACKDSTSPLNVTPDQLQAMGESVATELEAGAAQLTASDITATNGGAPSFSRVAPATVSLFRGLSMSRVPGAMSRSTSAGDISQCGVGSPSTPTDTDGDGIPDNWRLTFALPACHFVDQASGGSYDITGALYITDLSASPGFDLGFGLDHFKLQFQSTDGSGYVSRDGSGSVHASAGSLSQMQKWTEVAVFSGITSASIDIDWTATFAAAQGQSLTAGHALPDGTYTPNGGVNLRQGNREASFTVETKEALQYSASCAAGVANGTSVSPFSSGRVRVSVTSQQGSGYADVTYSGCNSATVTLVSQ